MRDYEYEYEYEREKREMDERMYRRTGVESYEQKLDRWRRGWQKELDDDLDNGR